MLNSHHWSEIAYFHEGTISVPCITCYDEMTFDIATKTQNIIPDGYKPSFDLKLVPDTDGIDKIILREIERDYHLDGLDIKDGDFIIDIGAHKGIVTCYLAKTYPQAKVLAFEPVNQNFNTLISNVILNGLHNIRASNDAVTKDGRTVQMVFNPGNSGGSNIYGDKGDIVTSLTLDNIFTYFKIDRVALLKIDCEGAEYEILDTELLSRIDRIRGEFHWGNGDANALLERVKKVIPDTIVTMQGAPA